MAKIGGRYDKVLLLLIEAVACGKLPAEVQPDVTSPSGLVPTIGRQREKGSSYQTAVRALAFKWIRILYRCWQTRTPYNESTYLNALKRRGSPLLKQLAVTR